MPEIRELTASVRQLDRQVGELGDDTRKLRTELSKVTRELRRQVVDTRVVGAVALLLLVTAGVVITLLVLDNRQDADRLAELAEKNRAAIEASEAKLCPLLNRLAPRAGAPAPAGTPEQRAYALETRRLLTDLARRNGCR